MKNFTIFDNIPTAKDQYMFCEQCGFTWVVEVNHAFRCVHCRGEVETRDVFIMLWEDWEHLVEDNDW